MKFECSFFSDVEEKMAHSTTTVIEGRKLTSDVAVCQVTQYVRGMGHECVRLNCDRYLQLSAVPVPKKASLLIFHTSERESECESLVTEACEDTSRTHHIHSPTPTK